LRSSKNPAGQGAGPDEPAVDLVALDIDGTVLRPDHSIAPSTAAAVHAARRRGVRIVLASSRGPVALAAIQQELGLTHEWFIGYQGALVARRVDAGLEVLAEKPMDPADAGEVEERAVSLGLSVGRYAGLRWRVPQLTEAIRAEAAITGETPVVGTREQRDADGAPHKVLAIAGDVDRIPALDLLAREVPGGVEATFSHRTYLEVTATGVDKASGLRPLLAHLAIRPDRTAAVGDGLNDLTLFAAVASPIAMGHAPPAVLAAATWVTRTNTDDGVAHALARLGVAPSPSFSPQAR
jgi:Cof subfamily protein (haloacid dehalogenase superfamily)